MAYRIDSFEFQNAAKVADFVVSNKDFHSYCQANISSEEYKQAIWMFRNIIYEHILWLSPGKSFTISNIKIERI